MSDTLVEQIVDFPLDIKLGNFLDGEINEVIKKTKNKKAAGLDNIPPEVWKTQAFNDILIDLCIAVYNGETIEKWTEDCILPFPKKGDLGLAKLLFNCIQPEVKKVLRKNGFRKNRSTVAQILTVRRIIEGVRAKNLQASLLFIDFSKVKTRMLRELFSISRGDNIPQNNSSMDPFRTSQKSYLSAECALLDIAGEKNKNLQVTFYSGHLAMATLWSGIQPSYILTK